MPILYPGVLPLGALIGKGDAPAPVQPAPAPVVAKGPPAPVWFSAQASENFDLQEDGRISCWRAVGDKSQRAEVMEFNKEGTPRDKIRGQVLFRAQSHGGLMIDGLLPNAPFSIGMLYTSDTKRDALSLFSLQAVGDADYSYLTAESGFLRFGHRDGEPVVSVADPRKTVLAVFSYDGTVARLAVNRAGAVSVDCVLPKAALKLMLGCRGFSRPLYNKLGTFILSNVMIWPGQDVLAGEFARAPDAALALWQERVRNGDQT